MSKRIRMTAAAVLGSVLVTTGCATKGQLQRGLEAQAAALEAERADAVRSYLISRGLSESHLRAVGHGEERLVVPAAAGEKHGAELNRRVVFVVETPEVAGVTTRSRGRSE